MLQLFKTLLHVFDELTLPLKGREIYVFRCLGLWAMGGGVCPLLELPGAGER